MLGPSKARLRLWAAVPMMLESLVHYQGLVHHLEGASLGSLLKGVVLSELGCHWLA